MTRYLGQGNFFFSVCVCVCGMMMGMPMKKIEKRIDSTGPEKKRLVRRDKGILFSFSTRNFVER